MSWGEFLLVVGCVIFAVALIIFLVTGFVVPAAIFSLKAWEVIYIEPLHGRSALFGICFFLEGRKRAGNSILKKTISILIFDECQMSVMTLKTREKNV